MRQKILEYGGIAIRLLAIVALLAIIIGCRVFCPVHGALKGLDADALGQMAAQGAIPLAGGRVRFAGDSLGDYWLMLNDRHGAMYAHRLPESTCDLLEWREAVVIDIPDSLTPLSWSDHAWSGRSWSVDTITNSR